MKQITIFDCESSNIKQTIIKSLSHYNIDNIYRNLEKRTYTFLEIYQLFSKDSSFSNYLNDFAEELKKYLVESDAYDDFVSKKSLSSFTKRKDCLIVYDVKAKSVGPVYCAEMLKDSLFEMEE